MKNILLLFILTTQAFALSVGDKVKCRGFLKESGQKKYYTLEGKILNKTKRSTYMVYGYSPVLNRKKLHEINMASCIAESDVFVKKVKKVVFIEEEVTVEAKKVVMKNLEPESKNIYTENSKVYTDEVDKNKEAKTDKIAIGSKEDVSKEVVKEVKEEEVKKEKIIAENKSKDLIEDIKDNKDDEKEEAAEVKKVENGEFKIKNYKDYLNYIKMRVL